MMRVLGVPVTVRFVAVALLPERVLRVLLLALLPEGLSVLMLTSGLRAGCACVAPVG